MRKLLVVPFVTLALAACSDDPVGVVGGPNFELANVDQRISADMVNAHVYGTFALSFTTGGSGGSGTIMSGPANFPGKPKDPGSCDSGLWINPQGKRTSGSVNRPHPHCVGAASEGVTVQVILEPISAHYGTFGSGGQGLLLGVHESNECSPWNDADCFAAHLTGNGDKSRGQGVIVAYAIDASTLGTTNKQVGTLTFDLSQYDTGNSDVNYFDTDCTIGEDEEAPRCLNLVISADYAPLAGPDGVGEVTENVTGFLYWSPAAQPFNY